MPGASAHKRERVTKIGSQNYWDLKDMPVCSVVIIYVKPAFAVPLKLKAK